MKKTIIMLCAIVFMSTSCKKEQDKIGNLKTFAKAYGYVKYFHPSDEAANVNWNNFAVYGADEISKCKTQTELINTLNKLFKPIAPSISFSNTKQDFDLQTITPENIEGYESVYWQHKGVSKDMTYQNGAYKSVRVNRYSDIDEASPFGNLSLSIDPEKYKGKDIKYTGWAKLKPGSKGKGYLWLRVDKQDNTVGFFENMSANPIISNEWTPYEIIGDVDVLASRLTLGCIIEGKGTLYADDIHLYYKENNQWIEIPIENNDFEAEQIGLKTEQSAWVGRGQGYSHQVSKTEKKEGEHGVAIVYEGIIKKIKGESIFEEFPKFGELIETEIGNGIFCQIPLTLYANKESTYPKSNNLSDLQNTLENIDESPSQLAVRLGNIINTYNVMQHFFPYFDAIDVNWDEQLEIALKRSYTDQTDNDHLITLQKLTAHLKDGHVWVSGGNMGQYAPPITWEWIEEQLIITNVFDNTLNIKIGDAVTKVNSVATADYFEEINSRISAGTKGWLNYRAQGSSMFGQENDTITLEINAKVIALNRDKKYTNGETVIDLQKNTYKLLDENIYYLNLNAIEMDTITKLIPKLKLAKGIICDMRGYPNGNHDLISHLLKEDDTSKTWMKIPKIIYPDQEKIVGYENHGWEMKAKEPYLGDKKIVFIIDGRAISYAESYMGFIKAYDLATIIGQPTAGANGNINPFKITGNYSITFTGMKVVKHDGSQHHAIGVLPDIFVSKTIEGVKLGKDEFLEEAIDIILKSSTANPIDY